jgi:hypothetical protein
VLAVGAFCAVETAMTAQAAIVYRCAPNLCRINGDGSGQSQLTSDGAGAAYHGASLSPDGTHMAFTRDTEDLFVADGNAQNPVGPLTRTATVAKISFDGTTVAYVEDFGLEFSLCTKPAMGSPEQPQTCTGTTAGFPAWGPSGEMVASEPEKGIDRVCVYIVADVEPRGCQRTVAEDPANNLEESAVSPDGSTLAAIAVAPGSANPAAGHLVLYDMASGALTRTLTSGTGDETPAWSPDGTHIAFARSGALFVTASTGAPGSEHQIAAGDAPTWGGSETAAATTVGGGATTSQPLAVTAASLTNKRFRVASKSTAISAKKAPLGTTLRFALSAAAKVQVAITRSAPGLRHGHSCAAPTARLRRSHALRCARTLTLGALTRGSEPIGSDSIAFSGRIGRRALSPGSYKAVISASNAGGHSNLVTLAFAVVR